MENSNKKVSIIIPCYNVEAYIERCIKSLIGQTIGVQNLELIFVNDASTDGTFQILEKYESRYPDSIILINNEINRKQGYARNIGMKYATGECIGFVDGDDWVDETMFLKMYHAIMEYDCDVAECEHLRTSSERKVQKELGDDFVYTVSDRETREALLVDMMNCAYICKKVYRREFLVSVKVEFPDDLIYEDEFFASIIFLYVKRYYYMPEILYYYYINPSSTTLSGTSVMKEFDTLKIEMSILDEMMKRNFYNEYRDYCEYRFIAKYYIQCLIRVFRKMKEPTSEIVEIISVMQLTVKNIFPDYNKNTYLSNSGQGGWKGFLKSVEKKITLDNIIEFQKQALHIFEVTG
ncbi:MAG: glycosyltransferase family 2 protein [Lachnospiraceae bacterium]|nr:glycosyltransferase family 2 protein [Lachnospiraceae bacterium]